MTKYHTFWPWKGKDYDHKKRMMFPKKIMLLGDRNIGTDPFCALTSLMVYWYLDPKQERAPWMDMLHDCERSLVGHETTLEERKKIWDSISYYNLLRVLLPNPQDEATDRQYKTSCEDFMINMVVAEWPDLVLVWGKKVWQHLPRHQRCLPWKKCPPLIVDGHEVEHGYYDNLGENKIRVVCIDYSSELSYEFWHKVIAKFMDFRRLRIPLL